MRYLRLIPLLCLLAATAGAAPDAARPLEEQSLAFLEQRLSDIEAELDELASYSLRSGVGTKGHRSDGHDDPDHTEWVEIELGEKVAIDQIALVPTILRDTKRGFVDEGFPVAFRIVVGTRENAEEDGIVVANFTEEDQLSPRIAPLVVPFPSTFADWVRVEATKLSPRGFEGRYFLQLAEIFVFSGPENVALRKPVRASSVPAIEVDHPGAWDRNHVVDGFAPYLMDAAQGEQSVAFVAKPHDRPVFDFDLGKPHPLSQIRLHTVEQSSTVPLSTAGDFGIPKRFTLEGANREDFTDAALLVEHERNGIRDVGPIASFPIKASPYRFFRLTTEPIDAASASDPYLRQIGFAEIELIADGRNVALHKTASTNAVPEFQLREIEALTDGRNFFGAILPERTWIEQLARRHDIEKERPLILAALNQRYARQKNTLKLVYWLLAVLAGGIILTILINRIANMRQVAAIKERLAADLHDELGANLHTIGLLSDLATEAKSDPDELDVILLRIRNQTEKSGSAVRHCTNMLEANHASTNLAENIHRISNRVMRRLKSTISIEGEEHLKKLKPKTCFDLTLFYKECLVNISRHAGATEFTTELKASDKEISLLVRDNGQGISQETAGGIPRSLKRRAHLLGATIAVEKAPSDGTQITLNLKTRKWGLRK
ncbi:histidine kinase [Pelagicoccus sp. SDUM812005]|uniref:histidine kinase n=1 Tax=Pelagicoccus sp. SDUM812005 TaxID=3041257 RepID=UPI00280C3FAB|nr:histidine kinase [Pelagicoccus sp. SDUM812005]MDQ8183471.1 histidine kinase [Pelagicoccus sp. SDUM812005]